MPIGLRLFGGAILEVDGGVVTGAAAQRHRLALLALLSVPEPRPVARDRIVAMLWPESDAERARNLLNQAVHSLRRALGDETILSLGDNLAIDAARIECDVHAFDRARLGGDPAAAAALYVGSFLDGFFLRGSTEFEQWVSAERDRLAHAYGEVLEEAARALEAVGDMRGAVDHWRRAANHDPVSASVALGLMRALAECGDTAAALRHAQSHAAWLHHELGIEPNPAVLRYEQELRDHPPEVALPPAPSAPAALDPTPDHVTASTTVARRSLKRWALAASVAIIAGAAAVLPRMLPTDAGTVPTTPQVVAVLPFRVSGADARLHYLREGMIDLLHARLTGEGGPRAVDPRTLLAVWNREAPAGQPDPDASEAAVLSARLGAGLMLLGEVVGTPERMVMSAAILRTSDARVMQRASVDGPADSLPALAERLAATLLLLAAGESHERLDMLLTRSPVALQAYLEGKTAYRASRYADAAVAFQRAVRIDSTFAVAAIGLALSAHWEGDAVVPAARTLARAGLARMSRADQLLVQLAGLPSDPDAPSDAEWLALAEELVQAAPDASESWTTLGDALVHAGASTGVPEWRRRAVEALDRAIALDSSFRPPRYHRFELAAIEGDTATVRRLQELEGQALDDELRWLAAVTRGDSATVRALEAPLIQGEGSGRAAGAVLPSIRFGIGPSRLRRFLILQRPPVTRFAARNRAAVNAALAQRMTWPDGIGAYEAAVAGLLDAVFSDANRAPADAAIVRNESGPRCSALPAAAEISPCNTVALLALGLYAWRSGDRAAVVQQADRIRQLPREGIGRRAIAAIELAALTLETVASTKDGRSDPRLLAQLDSLAGIADTRDEEVLVVTNFALAELHLRNDDPHAALRSLRRRPFYTVLLLGPALRTEGRLAALLGDSAAAVQAYTHYLALRDVPGQRSTAQVDSVRAELQQLTGSSLVQPQRSTGRTP